MVLLPIYAQKINFSHYRLLNCFPRNYDAEVYSFGKRLREEFDPELLRRALTERSFAVNLAEEQKRVGIENVSNSTYDNTEMAEKGEALINNFSTLYLRHTLPYYPEEGIQ